MTTTVLIKYRNHIPWGLIAVKFCSIKFSGKNKDFYEEFFEKAFFEKKTKVEKPYEIKMCELEKKIEEKTKERYSYYREYGNKTFFNSFSKREYWKRVKDNMHKADEELAFLKKEFEETEKNFKNAFSILQQVCFYEKLLEEKSFYLYQESRDREYGVTYLHYRLDD